jgi:REP element-mobilizing transposase RayT
MPDKYKGKYRTTSLRLQTWDYGWNGAYFITICTERMQHFFGEIENGKMHLSPLGALADVLWHEIKSHSKNVELDEFVVMPNHIHGILILKAPHTGDENAQKQTRHALSLDGTPGQKRFQDQGKNTISSIVGGYKSAVTKHANRLGYKFKWQKLFWDVIIRNDRSYQNIKNYIIKNPENWKGDRFSK